MPYIYWTALRDTGLGNTWTTLNISDRMDMGYGATRVAVLTIVSVAVIVLAVATAGVRLVPASWQLRGSAIRERTWPAFVATLMFVSIWFSQSVMPYRISGAVDYSGWPILQILHVEKRGLQFHERLVAVAGYRRGADANPSFVDFSNNERRLFQYRFEQNLDSGDELQPVLRDRVRAVIQSLEHSGRQPAEVKPLRKWNEEGWYVYGAGLGLQAYTTDRGETPPDEIVELFNELEKLPRSKETHEERRDVCLGFCYDPLSGLGALYANHRCRIDAHSEVVCR